MTVALPILQLPPDYCEYAAGACDQEFGDYLAAAATFLYPSKPTQIAATIESAISKLRVRSSDVYTSWKEFQTSGQVIFCAICKSIRFSKTVVADVSTLNFNLLFEIGYVLGLGHAVIPIRDTTIATSEEDFKDLGLLDTIGYLDFQNSDGLVSALSGRLPGRALPTPQVELNRETPLYVVRAHIPTEGDVRLLSVLQRSAVHSRTLDIVETPRVSLHEVRRQVYSSLGVLVHLTSPERKGARAHNARCALIAGMAMAAGKVVLMLQEDIVQQPIDYRDLVSSYTSPQQVPALVDLFLRDVIAELQDSHLKGALTPERFLERLDLGDVAAENESRALRHYFVRTAQFNEAKRGTARLVVGRKGAGKTALFYGVRDSIPKGNQHLVLELKPEGHQFAKLRETILSKLSAGMQEHTLTAFWNYMLLCELADKIRDTDYNWAQRDDGRSQRFKRVVDTYGQQVPADAGDFSERLQRQVDRMADRFLAQNDLENATGSELTNALFRGEIRALDEALAPYLREKDDVWVLIDNLDKGWPTRGTRSADILILRTLLEATRKLQRQLDQRAVGFHALLFLRNDIHEHLLVETPDRGKDTAIGLEWDDIEVFRELLRQRIRASTGSDAPFTVVWGQIAEPFVGISDSFTYIVERTLMRPRDLLSFVNRAVGVAINRSHSRVTADDILKAEEGFSEDMLANTAFELRDVYPEMMDVLYMFAHVPGTMSADEVDGILTEAASEENARQELLELLLWFGFLGIQEHEQHRSVFSYEVRYNIEKLLSPIRRGKAAFVVHRAFHKALGIVG